MYMYIFERVLIPFITDKFCSMVLPSGSAKVVPVQKGQGLRELKNAECPQGLTPGHNSCSLLQAEM